MMRGFKDCALEKGTSVTGGQTVMNPWCTIGRVATTVCQPNEFIIPDSAMAGDVLVIKKPIDVHIKSVHTKVKDFKCKKYNYSASTKGSVTRHISSV